MILMAFQYQTMDNPWIIHDNSIDSDSLSCTCTTALTDFMENPYVPHGTHVFPMEFHEFPMGYPWDISMRVVAMVSKNWKC